MVCERTAWRLIGALGLVCAMSDAARAQPAADPIGAVLDPPAAAPPLAPPQPPADEDAAEAPPAPPPMAPIPAPAAPAPALAPAAPLAYARPTQPTPYTPLPTPRPAYARPVTPSLAAPVHIDEAGRTPDRPLSPYDQSYDARLRASSASAQGMMGPLDGSWTLNIPGEGDIYVLELVDRGGGLLEGAWRDLRRRGAMGSSGFVEDIQQIGPTLTLRFSPAPGRDRSVASLTAQVDGRWSGELDEHGRRKPVTLRRN